jgi:hypothetical protein
MKTYIVLTILSLTNCCGIENPTKVTDCIMYSTNMDSCCYTEINKTGSCLSANGKYYGLKSINNIPYTCDLQYSKNTDLPSYRLCGKDDARIVDDCNAYSKADDSCCLVYVENTPVCVFLGYKAYFRKMTTDFSYTPMYCNSEIYSLSMFGLMMVLSLLF